MVSIIDFPPNLILTDRWTEPHLAFQTRSGGMALNGDEQLLSGLSARWELRVEVAIHTEADARSFRAIKTALKGKFGYLRLPLIEPSRITRGDIGAVPGRVWFGGGTGFSDGSSFALAQPSAPLVAAASAGDDTITVAASYFSGAMTAGVYFGLNDWLHHVDGWEEDGANFILTISPPLREDAAEGDDADFTGRAVWQLAEDATGKADLSEGGQHGVAELMLIEPVGRRLDAS
jgi:hypothetical protein